MGQSQLKKFQRLHHFDWVQMQTIEFELAQKRAELDCARKKRMNLGARLNQLQHVDAGGVHLATWRSMQSLMLENLKSEIESVKSEIADLNQAQEEIMNRLRDQNRKVKSWEKLIERMLKEHSKDLESKELKYADDRYLARLGRRSK